MKKSFIVLIALFSVFFIFSFAKAQTNYNSFEEVPENFKNTVKFDSKNFVSAYSTDTNFVANYNIDGVNHVAIVSVIDKSFYRTIYIENTMGFKFYDDLILEKDGIKYKFNYKSKLKYANYFYALDSIDFGDKTIQIMPSSNLSKITNKQINESDYYVFKSYERLLSFIEIYKNNPSIYKSLNNFLASQTQNYAVVSNDKPEDRLNLRKFPNKNAKSTGKFFNGTVFEVLNSKGDWVEVGTGNLRGWVMKKYLNFNISPTNVKTAAPNLKFNFEKYKTIPVYKYYYINDPNNPTTSKFNIVNTNDSTYDDIVILGFIGHDKNMYYYTNFGYYLEGWVNQKYFVEK